MPCPVMIGVGLSAVFGGSYVLLLRDKFRLVWWVLLLGTIVGWGLYFSSYRGDRSVLIINEVVSTALFVGGFFRIRTLRRRGETILGEELMARVGKALLAMTHPIIYVLKGVFIVLLLLDKLTSIELGPWPSISLGAMLVCYALRLPVGIASWKKTAPKSGCPFHAHAG